MKELKLIVAGGRDFNDFLLLEKTLIHLSDSTYADQAISIVSGMAPGADKLGYSFAVKHNVVCYPFPANWTKHGKRAGFLRNEEMAQFADALLAFTSGSKGTEHMIETMERLKKPVFIITY